jgi:hypothetical protein
MELKKLQLQNHCQRAKKSVIRTVNEDPGDELVFQVSRKVSYRTVLKGKTPPCTFVLQS